MERLRGDFPDFLGRRVVRTDRTDGLQLAFDDGAWVLMRLSGTEPLHARLHRSGDDEGIREYRRAGARMGIFRGGRGSQS